MQEHSPLIASSARASAKVRIPPLWRIVRDSNVFTINMPFLQIGYKRIHYTDLIPEHNVRETLIFMHGLGSSQNYYQAVALGLQAHRFRCITFDTTGSGRSPYTFVEQNIQSLSDDVIGILDALKVEKAIVVGHSMGG